MNKTVILSLSLFFSLMVILLSLFIIRGNRPTYTNDSNINKEAKIGQDLTNLNTSEKNSENSDKPTEEEFEYILKEFNGKIAVFKKDESIPNYIFNVYINNLPQGDQKDLSKGIYVKDDMELNRLTEDYSG